MPTYHRRDDWVDMSIFGQAIPNVAVTYYVQPSLALAPVFDGPEGNPVSNPQITDGTGHSIAYVSPGIYTITYSGMQLQTLILPDQEVAEGGGGGGGGSTVTAFAGVPQGVIDGVNRAFTLTNAGIPLTTFPTQATVWFNFPLVPGIGYTLTGVTIIYSNPPQPASGGSPADAIYAEGFTIS
jgi:hypothetical protein